MLIDDLLATTRVLQEHVSTQQGQLERLETMTRQEYGTRSILQKLLSTKPDALESFDVTTLQEHRGEVRRLVHHLSLLEKRDLPPGSQTLSAFCKRHSEEQMLVHPSTVKGQLEAECLISELVTIYERPTASTYTKEWWLTPDQQHKLILFWRSRSKPFKQCPECPHNDIRVVETTQASSVPA